MQPVLRNIELECLVKTGHSNKPKKRGPASLIIRKRYIETTVRYHLTPFRWLLLREQKRSVDEDVEI